MAPVAVVRAALQEHILCQTKCVPGIINLGPQSKLASNNTAKAQYDH